MTGDKRMKKNGELERGRRDELIGEVVSDKMNKTVGVEIFRLVKHAKYSKFIKRSSIFKAHNESDVAKLGDRVMIVACRPMSKTKRWKVVKVLDKADRQPEAAV